MAKLLPCPFCGEEAQILQHHFPTSVAFTVECKKCKSNAENVGIWNNRVSGPTLNMTDIKPCPFCGQTPTLCHFDTLICCDNAKCFIYQKPATYQQWNNRGLSPSAY
jgi:hypothetical protein